jgi:tetratricopeptide (TPR) repeat protein
MANPPTTNGTIAVVNLHAQIDGLTAATMRATPSASEQLGLIDLLALRGHVLGRVADYEQAHELAEQLIRDAPHDPISFLARARTSATFHRFDEAQADLDSAELLGLDRDTLDAERAVILQALRDHAQARTLYESAARRRRDFAAIGALAVLEAESGDVAAAEQLFAEARRRYRSTSPFALASLDFRRGLMWLREGDLPAAYSWFDAARRRVPAYAPAVARLAEIDMARGERKTAIDRLRPLTSSGDDPAYAAALAHALNAAGRLHKAEQLQAAASARYEQLALRHPEAYADHAADFHHDALSHPVH